MADWKLKNYFETSDGHVFEFASFKNGQNTVIAQWMALGKRGNHSPFILEIYDDEECLNAKYISIEDFDLLLSNWKSFMLNKRQPTTVH